MKRALQGTTRITLLMILTVTAATALKITGAVQAQSAASTHSIHHYMIVNGDTQSGSWSSEDSPNVRELRSRYGYSFAWFREGGREYIITDADVMAEVDKAMQPQKKVNAMQADVNADQSRVNEMQSKVNARQHDVNAVQQEVNRRQYFANQIQSTVSKGSSAADIDRLQAELKEMRSKPEVSQSSVNQMQSKVNEEQQGVNAEQAKVNEKQRVVNQEQHRVSAEFNVRVNQIFEQALEQGTAQPVK